MENPDSDLMEVCRYSQILDGIAHGVEKQPLTREEAEDIRGYLEGYIKVLRRRVGRYRRQKNV